MARSTAAACGFENGCFMVQIAVDNDEPLPYPAGALQETPEARLVSMGNGFNDGQAQVEQDIGMHVVRFKKRFDSELMLTGLKAQGCCQGLLHIHREQIIFAPMAVMEGVSHAKEKIQRRFH